MLAYTHISMVIILLQVLKMGIQFRFLLQVSPNQSVYGLIPLPLNKSIKA